MVRECGMLSSPAELPTRDNPEAYIPRDRRRSLATGLPIPDRVTGAAIFADISGFTPLTEALAKELGPQRGAEELTATLGRVFHEIIAELDRFGGDVIYFSGDAITCWIDGDDGMRATACGLAMQDAMARVGTITTPAGETVQLAVKVAVAVGDARRFLVGDPDIQLIDVLAGRLIDDLADAEHHTEKGEVVLDPSAVASVGERVVMEIRQGDDDAEDGGGRTFGVVRGLAVPVADTPAPEPPHPLPEEVVREWLLPAVYERLSAGRGEFLAELRPAYPVFLRFGGIDYDDDDDAISKLDDFVRRAQQVMHGYGGNVLQLTLGDKGAYLYGVFGSPIAHEDDAARAAAAALDLAALEGNSAATGIQIGVTHGQLRSGTYGHEMRRTFVCLGDAVNLSARLMSAAPAGSIYVTQDVHDGAGDAFVWQPLPAMKVKGKAAPISPYALTGSLARASRRKTRFQLPLVGRRTELAMLEACRADASGGRGQVVGISAEAGMGKSRLLAEFVRATRRSGRLVAFGECEAFGTKTAYFVWREVWRRLFGLEGDQSEERQIAALEARLAAIDPGLVARTPLLDDVVGLTIPDTDLTRRFDAKLRKSSLEDLLATCLQAFAREEPLVIALEDCHWIDELSLDLLEVLARSATAQPVLFVLAYRPATESGGGLGLARLPMFTELVLDRMEQAEVGEIVRAKLSQLLGDDAGASPELVELIAARSDGNPFYVEELLSYIASQGIDTADADAIASVQLPESLQSLVLSRIDGAPEEPRRTMKVAAVVGRTFQVPVLPGAYEELGTVDTVLEHLETLRSRDLVALDREAEQAWIFVHGMTQEMAYESLPFAMRSLLHGRIGAYIERSEAHDLERWIPLLEHHYWRSDREGKKREYLIKAAEQAQAAYANAAAVVYYDRLLPLLDGAERVEEAIKFAEVLQLIGDIPRAEEVVLEARAVAEQLEDARQVARCDHSLAESARRMGRYDEALARLEQASEGFRSVGDELGVAAAYQIVGTVNAQRGDLEIARSRYLDSLAIRERLDDGAGVAALTNNLGIVALHMGEHERARDFGERALELYTELGDRRRICQCEINLSMVDEATGDHEAALGHSERAVSLAREVGDRLSFAQAQNIRGDALRDLDRLDAAGMAYATALRAYRDLNDQWPLMILFEDIAALAARLDRPGESLTLVGAADALRVAIGATQSAADEELLEARLERATSALGDAVASEARDAGRRLSLDGAIELALGVSEVAAG